ncbi:Lrp/AsnC family transcriptional regulator [Natronoglycomyces albus]|uniref:Lrp/AsnC ligand binding domain-containing protein n=1 Tax=Natronoglycomyces albus TaxID=2811108 RepID=A0A895XVD0_9ACTN|nr:Lrp/AsnC ligand binding domain-containing protein [Natronoglycomyces albus]QSB06180.1 Lrp/AsnC ligand binding domain-containing protein [Natronoglycomyces albus]
MVQAFILIQTEVGSLYAVAEQLRQIPGVVHANPVTGPYDVVALTEAATVGDLGELVISKVQQVKGISRTLTCPVLRQ